MTSSDRGTDEDERKRLVERFQKAAIPPRLWKAKAKDYRSKAPTLFDYLESDARSDDIANGIGIALYGNPAIRTDVFGMVAKGHAAAAQSVQLLSVHRLLYFMEHDDERKRECAKVKHLFVDGFEKEFTTDATSPYTYYQQIEIEEFLQSRRDAGLLNHYSVSNKWSAVKWWTREFIAAQGAAVVEIKL